MSFVCNPLAFTSGAYGYVVQVPEAGYAVMLHAQNEATIKDICAAVIPMLGGGHA